MRGRSSLAAAALIAVAAVSTILPAAASGGPMVIAHRGGAGLWPENTMGAFRNAQDLFETEGVPGWIELDTQFTSDEVLVVIHDATLDRTTTGEGCTGPVVEKSAEFVTSTCDADPDPDVFDPVPTLAQVLEEGRDAGWRLVVEIKDIPGEPGFEPTCAKLADALRAETVAAGFPVEDLIVQSFWPPCLDRLETTAPAIATLLLTSSTTFNELAGLPDQVPLGFTLTANAAFSTLRGYEYSAPDQASPDLIEPVVNGAQLLGRRVVVWTVNETSRMEQLAGIGVDGIITDRPDLLIAALS